MARSLFWTERVAISALIVFVFSIQPVLSQSSRTTSITYSCRATSLESVIEFLSSTTGYHFIYSRDMVDITSPVSLDVNTRTIEDVLTLVKKQVNVSFKVQDRHIIVKALPKTDVPAKPIAVTQPVATKTTLALPVLNPKEISLLSSVSKSISVRPMTSNRTILESRLERRIRELQATLGPNVPRNIPPMYINRINFNNRNSGWFASVGTVVGDYANSFEVQGGIRYLYAVVQPRWSVERGFYGVYGIGNSFTLMRNFSFNTIYMYSVSKQSQTIYPFNPIAKLGPEFGLTETMHHHQVKFAVQYAISQNVAFRGGPVLNYISNVTELVAPPRATGYYYEGTFTYRQSGLPDIVYRNGQFLSTSVRHLQSWLGWEVAVSYRVNFSKRQ